MAQVSCGGNISVVNTCLSSGGGNVVQVSLPDNATTPVAIPKINTVGSYTLLVQPLNYPGATANFMAANSSSSLSGSVARITNATSPTGEEIDITWTAGNPINLYHSVTKTGGTGALITYRVLIITIA